MALDEDPKRCLIDCDVVVKVCGIECDVTCGMVDAFKVDQVFLVLVVFLNCSNGGSVNWVGGGLSYFCNGIVWWC